MHQSRVKKKKLYSAWKNNLTGYLFVAPAVVFFTVFVGAPIITNCFILCFANFSLLGDLKWCGLANFKELFSDEAFYTVFGNTFKFIAVIAPIHIIGGLIIAALINSVRNHFFHGLFRTVFYFPLVVTTSSIAIVWGYMYDNSFGVFNWVLNTLGKGSIRWTGDSRWALLSVAIFSAWKFIGNAFLYYYIGLRNIPDTYMEAARIDGANKIQGFFRIKLPLLTPTIFFVVTTTLINCFQIFDEPYFLTNGGPGVSSQTIAMQIYRKGFGQYHFGYASSLGVILFLMVLIVTIIMFKYQSKWVVYDNE